MFGQYGDNALLIETQFGDEVMIEGYFILYRNWILMTKYYQHLESQYKESAIHGANIKVGMADLNVCKAPDAITTLGLGSCIGIAVYDPVTKIGGLAHIMLPDSTKIRNNSNIAKFADTGIEELIRKVTAAGASKARLVAKIAGGARMFEVSGLSEVGNIGAKNAEASKKKLKELGIRIVAEDTGLNYGRTVVLDCNTGDFMIKSVGKENKII